MVRGLGQRRGGVPAPPSEGGGVPPPPPYSPPNCRTPLGVTHWLAAAPVIVGPILSHILGYLRTPENAPVGLPGSRHSWLEGGGVGNGRPPPPSAHPLGS